VRTWSDFETQFGGFDPRFYLGYAVSHFFANGGSEAVVVRAAHVALGMVLLQLAVASAMVLLHLPPVLRSLHEATGVGIWLSCFLLAYLARRAVPVVEAGAEASPAFADRVRAAPAVEA